MHQDHELGVRDLLAELRPVDVENGHARRVGCRGDGGYVILGDERLRGMTLYSYGIGENDSFDRHFRRIYGSPVRQFDHTVAPREPKPGWSLKLEALATRPGPDAGTFEGHLAEFGDSASSIFLKLDVEGAEWEILASLPGRLLDQCAQVVCELHDLSGLGAATAYPVASHATKLKALQALTARFHCWHVHANNYAPLRVAGGYLVPDVLEVTFVNKDWYPRRGWASRAFPTPLDDPCCLRDEDWALDFWPFSRFDSEPEPVEAARESEVRHARPKPAFRRRLDRLTRDLQRKPWR